MAWDMVEPDAGPMETCELCVIGAGIAGLNALYAAAQYLGKNERVVLIDQKATAGGMWTEVYDYAHLQQPHPSFTVGDIPWDWTKPADHLATGSEVAAHLSLCHKMLRRDLDLVERFGHTVTSCYEMADEGGPYVRIAYHANSQPGRVRILTARRMIKAAGYDVPKPRPLAFSSTRVHSTTPQRLCQEGLLDNTSPVYIVGGGKTGMDTAHALISRNPRRCVTLLNGMGAVFADRDVIAPAGAQRWWRGRLLGSIFRDLALRFDGANEAEVFDHLQQAYSLGVTRGGEQFFFGILSRQERDLIAEGLDAVIDDHLDDVLDGVPAPQMRLRAGGLQPVPTGSVFVNCTGHLMRRDRPYEPYLSAGGAILSITPRSMVHYQTSLSSYLLSHLFFAGKLRETQLYELDGQQLRRVGGQTYHAAVIALSFMNTILAHRALPADAVRRCRLDPDRGFPLPRRLAQAADIARNGDHYVLHCREALDLVGKVYAVRCGPLRGVSTGARHVVWV